MNKVYGDLMNYLLRYRGRYSTEQEFRAFLADAARRLARDLRDFEVEVSPAPTAVAVEQGRDRNALKIGCE